MLELIDGRGSPGPIHIPRPDVMGAGGGASSAVRDIVQDVRLRGDAAVIEYTERFDGVAIPAGGLRVEPEELQAARDRMPAELLAALEVMNERLTAVHERQVTRGWTDERGDEMVGELVRPLRRVGVYVPGGRAAYPSTVLMAAVPARIAEVEGIAVASPPSSDGAIADAILAACAVAGVTEVYRVGGAQAVAALAYGTETVRPVEKIVGPGNVYVTLAKRLVQGWVGIDAEAGPTEIAIVADATADPAVIAADLIAQAEHGPHGSHVLITWEPMLADAVMVALEEELHGHERADDVENALTEGGTAVLVRDLDQAMETANAFAAEHLELLFDGAEAAVDRVQSAGSVFVGPYSPVPAGDYVGGTNHVLPSGGTARWASGLSTRDFIKTIYVSRLERSSLERLARHIEALAAAEGLAAHARAVDLRLAGRGAI